MVVQWMNALYIIWFAFTDPFIELEEVNNGEGLMKE